MTRHERQLPLYLSAPHDCSYLAGRVSNTLFADPGGDMDMATYSQLLQQGFRRSGRIVYAPRCEACRQCISVRVPVRGFKPKRIHRRVLRANDDVTVHLRPPRFDPEHFALYKHYTAARHGDGEMANASPETYMEFLHTDWCDTAFIEFRLEDRLVAVAATDLPDDGLSAVYTFFDPALASRSLGTFAILQQIEAARRRGLDYVYLGYWIRDSRKMHYKAGFRPLQLWFDGRWQAVGATDPLPNPDLPTDS
ncbi:MAG: arginyltransferase [Gammaproteobacteria bacterium]|nr:arginyltransferase [Gammaproteobacteria bacterium]